MERQSRRRALFALGPTLAPAALPVQRQSRAKRPLCSAAPCRLTPSAGAHLACLTSNAHHRREDKRAFACRQGVICTGHQPCVGSSLFSLETPIPFWDPTEDEDPLGRCPVIFRPYILHGAYWYESVCFRGNGWNSAPQPPANIAGASPETPRSTSDRRSEISLFPDSAGNKGRFAQPVRALFPFLGLTTTCWSLFGD